VGLLRLAVALTVIAVLAGGGWLWLRNSSLAAVTDVEITGTSSSQSSQVQSALTAAAKSMTTLHVSEQALTDAVAPYSSVAAVTAKADFPHRLSIVVTERKPVAAFTEGNSRVPLTGSGDVLRGVSADRNLPTIKLGKPIAGKKVTDHQVLSALTVARTAPQPLLKAAKQLTFGAKGVIVQLNDGPDLIFGSGAYSTAKWTAAARVLAEPSAAGASYLDLRVPGRVAAGGLAPLPQETPTPTPEVQG
jgi:cell division protein FtsQ